MIWFYRLLFIPAFLIAIPYYAMRMIRRGGYAKDFSHRFGGQKNLPKVAKGKTRFWIQAVSVGEVEAIKDTNQQLDAEVEKLLGKKGVVVVEVN
jgi:3-deoxy-D-manno-octulosonic-acid transferase